MSSLSSNSINAIIWTADSIAILATACRLYIRARIIRRFYWDDAVHIVAMLCMIIQSAMYSGTRALVDSVRNYQSHQTHIIPNFKLYLQINISATIVAITCFWAVKLCYMLFYRTLFRVSDRFMKAWWIVLSFVFATYWVSVITALVQCGGNGLKITDVATCSSAETKRLDGKIFKVSFAMNISSDLAIMALPLAMLPKLHKTRLGQKIGIGAMFSLTFIVIAFEIVRLVESLKGTGSSLNIVWISTEASIAVILSCIPSFNALIRHREKSKAIATVIASEYAELAASKTISRNKSTTPLAESHSAKSQDEVSQNIPLEHYDARDCV